MGTRPPSAADLVRRLGDNGWLSWRRFMEAALYDPEFGYYTSGIRDVGGRRADFATSPTLHQAVGTAVARWIRHRLAEGSCPRSPLPVLEIGAGNGALAECVLDRLGWFRRRRIRPHIVETSPVLTARQRDRSSLRRRIRDWHATVPDALAAVQAHAPHATRLVVFSNELVDAFPASVWRWDATDRRWRELGLAAARDGTVTESPRPKADDDDAHPEPDSTAADPAAWPGGGPPDGQRIEVHDAFRDWLDEWLPSAPAGLDLLTIDYGDRFPALYHRRPAGTLRGYLGHFAIHGPDLHARPGRQDLTADVNFSDVERWLARHGVVTAAFATQRSFVLEQLGCRPEALDRRDPRLDFILAADGAGSAFKVLHSRRPPDHPNSSSGPISPGHH